MDTQSNNITTERFFLRNFNDSDLENLFLGLSHPKVIKYYGISFKTIEATKEQLNWFKNLETTKTGIWWAIYSKDNTRFYGAIGFNNLDQPNKKVELGFWLLPKYWGKGIISECMPLVCNYAFAELKLHRIEAFVETKNSNCTKLLKKFHFNLEGTMKDYEIKKEAFVSLDIYSKLNPKEVG